MAQISGIEYEKNTKGENTHIRINLKKYGKQLQPFLEQIGIAETIDDFDEEWKNSYTSKEARAISKNRINAWWKK